MNAVKELSVTIDFGRSLADMIYAGRYDWHDDNITDTHFPVSEGGYDTTRVGLFHLDRNLRSSGVVSIIKQADWQPAPIEALLALGEHHPELQRDFPIICLDTVWRPVNGLGLVAFIGQHVTRRDVSIATHNFFWHSACRFAAVHH